MRAELFDAIHCSLSLITWLLIVIIERLVKVKAEVRIKRLGKYNDFYSLLRVGRTVTCIINPLPNNFLFDLVR